MRNVRNGFLILSCLALGSTGAWAAEKAEKAEKEPSSQPFAAKATGAMLEAIIAGDAGAVKKALADKADPNGRDESGKPALCFAAELKHVEIVKVLLAAGAEATIRNTGTFAGLTPLHYCVGHGQTEIAQLLLDKGAKVNAKGKWDATPIHLAAFNGHENAVLFLLAKGADPLAVKDDGNSVLHELCRSTFSQPAAVKAVLEAKADVRAANNQGQTPLHQAAMAGHKDIVALLLDNGADIAAKDKKDKTALALAKRMRKTEVVQLLESRGAKE